MARENTDDLAASNVASRSKGDRRGRADVRLIPSRPQLAVLVTSLRASGAGRGQTLHLNMQHLSLRAHFPLCTLLSPASLPQKNTTLQSLEAKLGQISRADKAAAAAAASATSSDAFEGGGEGGEDAEMGEAMTVPLEEAFMSRTEEGEVCTGFRRCVFCFFSVFFVGAVTIRWVVVDYDVDVVVHAGGTHRPAIVASMIS